MGLSLHPPRPGPPEAYLYPVPRSIELGQGLQGLLVEEHRLPLVQLQVSVRAGAAFDLPGSEGAAYACSAMIDEGAGRRSALQLSTALQQLGAALSLFAGYDSSSLALAVLRDNLEPALDLLFEVLLRPRFEAPEWRRVREELIGRGLQQRDSPGDMASLALSGLVYGEHPYGRPLLPRPERVKELSLAEVRSFYRAHYHRDGSLLVAGGDLSPADFRRLLGRRVAGWEARRAAPIWPARTPPPPPLRRIGLLDRPGAPQSVLRVGHLCPPRRQVSWAGVRLLNTILGGSFTSRLNLNLRERHGFTYGVRSYFMLPRGPGLLGIGTSVETDNTVPALREILHELSELRRKPVGRAELEKARQLVIESLPEQAETVEDMTEEYALLALHELPLDELARLPEAVSRIDAPALQQLARELLHPDRATLVVVGDAARLESPLRKLAGELVHLDQDGRPLPGKRRGRSR